MTRAVLVCLMGFTFLACSVDRAAPSTPTRLANPVDDGPGTRAGPRPRTSDAPPGTMTAHQQLDQNAPKALQDALFDRVMGLPYITTGQSLISVPGARAFFLPQDRVQVDDLVHGVEFGHIHPEHDGSLHVTLGREEVARIEASGWGEAHPKAPSAAMIYGPRDEAELEIVFGFVRLAYDRAVGADAR